MWKVGQEVWDVVYGRGVVETEQQFGIYSDSGGYFRKDCYKFFKIGEEIY